MVQLTVPKLLWSCTVCEKTRVTNRDEDNASSDKQSIELKQEKGLDDAKRKTESGPEKRISTTEK